MLADGVVGQAIGFHVVFAADVCDGKTQRPCQLAASPVQRIKTGTAAGVLATHLLNDDFRIGKNVQDFGFQSESQLQSLEESYVLGNVVVLAADPLGNADLAAESVFEYDADARGPRIAVRTAVHVGYEV